jgi:hypothetical protein
VDDADEVVHPTGEDGLAREGAHSLGIECGRLRLFPLCYPAVVHQSTKK